MSEQPVDFGDMISAVIEANAAKAKAVREASAQKAAEANRVRLEALRPLLIVLRQAQERFPRMSLFDIGEFGTPHFYMGGDTRIEVIYSPTTNVVSLVQKVSGRGYHKPDETLAESVFAEELIPLLVEKLAILATRNK